jgi:hypothetical protein
MSLNIQCRGVTSKGNQCNRREGYTANQITNGLWCACGGIFCADHCYHCNRNCEYNSCDDSDNTYESTFINDDSSNNNDIEFSCLSETELNDLSETDFSDNDDIISANFETISDNGINKRKLSNKNESGTKKNRF